MKIENYINQLSKSKLAIYLFHGVIKKNVKEIRNYTNKHITSDKFEYLLEELKKKGKCLSLREIASHINNNKRFPEYSYAITFDDGFKNNYNVAIPILKKYKTNATFFISSDFIENNTMSWIDSIEYCLEKSDIKNIKIPGLPKKINIIGSKQKIKILKHLRRYIKSNKRSVNTDILIKNFYKNSNLKYIKLTSNDILDQKLNWKEVRKINSDKLFDIGGHSHNHLSFGFLSKKETEFQIKKSIKLIRKHTGILVDLYSYPEGQEIDFDDK